MKKPYTLLTPGPVPLTGSAREILSKQPLYHRGLKFQHILKEVKKDLQTFFQTQESVIILTSTGTGAMEAALTNTLSPGDLALCVCSGKFGERWKEIAQAHKIKTEILDIPWGEAVSVKKIQDHLNKNKQVRALLISACETSTATNHPIQEISQLLKNYPDVLFIVDGITGLGSMYLPMDAWGIDVLIGGSQKSFALPTGMSFIALSQKAWDFEKKSKCPKYYFQLKREKQDQDQGKTSFSINVTFIQALKNNLKYLLDADQSLNTQIKRCEQLAQTTQVFCKEMGLSLLSQNPSSSVTAIKMPEGLSGNHMKTVVEEKENIIISGGQEKLRDKIIRIGHLGAIKDEDLLRCLQALSHEFHLQKPQQFSLKQCQKAMETTRKQLQT